MTGANPTDRGKSGTKRQVLTDQKGIPLSVSITGANTHDMKAAIDTLDTTIVDWGITFNIIVPYIMAIHQKAVEENIDLKTSASNLIHDIRENRQLGTLQSTIKHLEERVSALNELNMQKQQAVITLMILQMAGFSEKDIAELVELVNRWKGGPGLGQGNGHKKLDTELIGVGN